MQPITHYGYGDAVVKEVASIAVERLPDAQRGRMRGSSCKIEGSHHTAGRAYRSRRLGVELLERRPTPSRSSALCCHPQSYYRLGIPSPDFLAARFIRGQDVNMALHVHFNGAATSLLENTTMALRANRIILATRLAAGMERL